MTQQESRWNPDGGGKEKACPDPEEGREDVLHEAAAHELGGEATAHRDRMWEQRRRKQLQRRNGCPDRNYEDGTCQTKQRDRTMGSTHGVRAGKYRTPLDAAAIARGQSLD
jgi:hypothetical protein